MAFSTLCFLEKVLLYSPHMRIRRTDVVSRNSEFIKAPKQKIFLNAQFVVKLKDSFLR